MIGANIRIQRRQVQDLHEWLDTFASGWSYFNADQQGTRDSNECFALQSIDVGTGDHTADITVNIPTKEMVLLLRLSWDAWII